MSETFNVIKYLRDEANTSQESLADFLGVSRPTIIKYEKSLTNMPLDLVKKLADYFNVDYDCFINNTAPKTYTYNIIEMEKSDTQDMRIDIPAQNVEKFKQVFLYILNKVGAKANVGQTVIYKLLYFIDFDYYELYENQLMGLKYQKNTFGPTPIDFGQLIKRMESSGEIELVKSQYYNKEMTKYLPTKEANLSLFNANEIKHIDAIISKLSDKNASELSELSHKDIPWIVTEDKKIIEYETVFYRTQETSVRSYDYDE